MADSKPRLNPEADKAFRQTFAQILYERTGLRWKVTRNDDPPPVSETPAAHSAGRGRRGSQDRGGEG